MPRCVINLSTSRRIALIAVVAALQACGGSRRHTGRRILAELEDSRVPIPDETGRGRDFSQHPSLPESGPITLADLLELAEATSPDLAAARSEIGIASGRMWQASLYPNPRVELSTEDLAWRHGVSHATTALGFTQPIILGDRRKAAMRSAEAERSARSAEVEARRRVLFGEIAFLHSRLIALRDQERLYAELGELVGRTLLSAQTRFDAKAAPETDVIRPRVELSRVEAAQARLAQERLSVAKELGLLVGDITIDPARLEGSLPLTPASLDSQQLDAAVRRTHPSLAAAELTIDAAAARLDQVRAEKTPDLDVRVGVGYNGELDSGIVDVGVGMTVPLWDQREGETLSARFALARARQERSGVEITLRRRLGDAVGEYEAARAQLGTFRDKIAPDAQRAFDQTSEGYRAGRASFLDLLDAQRTLTEARVTLAELAGAAAAARAKILQVVGPDGLNSPSSPALFTTDELASPIPVRPQGAEVKR